MGGWIPLSTLLREWLASKSNHFNRPDDPARIAAINLGERGRVALFHSRRSSVSGVASSSTRSFHRRAALRQVRRDTL